MPEEHEVKRYAREPRPQDLVPCDQILTQTEFGGGERPSPTTVDGRVGYNVKVQANPTSEKGDKPGGDFFFYGQKFYPKDCLEDGKPLQAGNWIPNDVTSTPKLAMIPKPPAHGGAVKTAEGAGYETVKQPHKGTR